MRIKHVCNIINTNDHDIIKRTMINSMSGNIDKS